MIEICAGGASQRASGRILKLDADAMEALTKEERAWVQEKEKQVKDAGSEWEGGSGQPLAENTEAANLTRERVYVLAEYLK